MLKCLLNSFLFVTLSIAAPSEELKDDLSGLRMLVGDNNNDGTIGNFHPNKITINENELKLLDKLDTTTDLRQKRDVGNTFKYDDAPPKPQPTLDEDENFYSKSSLQSIEVPMKSGSSAFSIRAEKVYILYPSLFQDPNIYGRFSIPQNINLDPLRETTSTKSTEKTEETLPASLSSIPKMFMSEDELNFDPFQPTTRNRRQATSSNQLQDSSENDENKKRNVETHMKGTIVVLNQDVNEYNRKESY